MNDQSASGNRWEPTPGDAAAPDTTAPPQPPGPPGPPAPATRGWRRHVTPARGAIAAGATAIFLVGGVGGFAVGHAVSGADRDTVVPAQGPGFGPDGDDGFGRHDGAGPGGAPGQAPGEDSNGDADGSDTDES